MKGLSISFRALSRLFLAGLLTASLFLSASTLYAFEASKDTPEFIRKFNTDVKAAKTDKDRLNIVKKFVDEIKTYALPYPFGERVTFVYFNEGEGKTPPKVEVTGDFTGWFKPVAMQTIKGTGFYYYTMDDMPQKARIEYKFKVNGKEVLDPLNPRRNDNGVGGENSFFSMPRYIPLVVFPATGPKGTLKPLEIKSEILKGSRQATVYTPPGYDGAAGEKYPLLIVHDGSQYLKSAQFADIVDDLIEAGTIKKLVIVFADPVERTKEYAQNADYMRFVKEELMPLIQKEYRVTGNPGDTGVMGASMGGLISLSLASAYPELFGLVASQSGALAHQGTTLVKDFTDSEKKPLKIYTDVGLYDLVCKDSSFLRANRSFDRLLRDKGYDHLYIEFPGGHHWVCWRDRIPDVLEFLYGKGK
ncbi:MAG: alpha/beta hydrolase-fold protein [Candidatus Eremiobacteraeota bacterium]|nr:alpha/beta hydrolase-fold protein [Candidatus Eremiobacteraeota bacterium]